MDDASASVGIEFLLLAKLFSRQKINRKLTT